ncbi:iron-siderophore ABC transporter substrate-binding protein [Paenibacillus rhizovicinus]|uniref:Iron-siderophore ABC transporter substrate-binding protein n=1 Tax=Paenibacillus rhizovicinus TaxID=2704463 RepID=A0A6C0P3F6_9BACL|nr:iron-siderophore ABC transporter substrate-binding protein [Paenibacillus rhizovicinus]QHW33028.1 iron-siderophore ABC transporter substrate-binding protein [Paenibacillus rhizovicinus]
MVALARKKLSWSVLSVLIVLSVVISGCGQSNSADNANNGTTNTGNAANTGNANKAAADSADAAERKITHAMGETVIKGTPARIVVLTNEGTEALLALGVKPVGAVKSWTGDPWYAHIAKDMDGVTVVGEESQPNLELIASLKPDLIIGNKLRQEKVYEQLKAIAPTIFSETLRGAWQSNFTLYADAIGKKAEGEKIIADYDARTADFKAKAGDKLNQKVSVVRFMAGKTRIYLSDTFTGIAFSKLGITRPDSQNGYKDTFVEEITKERLPEVDADRLFYFTYETGDGKGTQMEEEMLKDPLWKSLNVVKNNKAIKVDDAIWNTAGGVIAANLMLDELYKIYDIKA